MLSTRFTLHSLVTEAHKTIQGYLPNNGISIDATMGNGHDTLFLARHSAKVYAFDIQAVALTNTRQRLQKNGFNFNPQTHPEIHLIHKGHEHMAHAIPGNEKIDAIMFNLGYLPHGENPIITQKHSTLTALKQSLQLLNRQGVLSILAYPGHAGGKAELDAIINWSQQLDDAAYAITLIHSIKETTESPRLFIISPIN